MKKYSLEWWASLKPEAVGKETERLVEKLFAEWNCMTAFSWHRLPDARSSGGRVAAQPADYIWWCLPHGGYLEVKATQHTHRLAKDKVRQIPLLHKHSLAGAKNYVLVHHYMQSCWRVVPATSLAIGLPSWDLSKFPTYPTATEALKSTGMF